LFYMYPQTYQPQPALIFQLVLSRTAESQQAPCPIFFLRYRQRVESIQQAGTWPPTHPGRHKTAASLPYDLLICACHTWQEPRYHFFIVPSIGAFRPSQEPCSPLCIVPSTLAGAVLSSLSFSRRRHGPNGAYLMDMPVH